MIYIENILICLAAPLLISIFFLKEEQRQFGVFFLVGMVVCFFSAYVNSFFTYLYGVSAMVSAIEITPVCEETMKLLPLLFFVLVFKREKNDIIAASVAVSVGFATFENCCYITENGAADISYLLIRGFGAGAMHIVCGVIIGSVLAYIWMRRWLTVVGTLGNLCIVITYHAVYNLLIVEKGAVQIVGYLLPMVTIIVAFFLKKWFLRELDKDT